MLHFATIFAAILAVHPLSTGADTAQARLAGRGVSRALAEERARTISRVRYALSLDVTGLDSAVGHVTIRFARSGTGDVILDFRGRGLDHGAVNGQRLPSDSWNGAHVRIPARFLHAGENIVLLAFVAEIAPTGASIIRFHDRADNSDYLYTLLVPADANQLFPASTSPT